MFVFAQVSSMKTKLRGRSAPAAASTGRGGGSRQGGAALRRVGSFFERVAGGVHELPDGAAVHLQAAIRQFGHQPTERERVSDPLQQSRLKRSHDLARRLAPRPGRRCSLTTLVGLWPSSGRPARRTAMAAIVIALSGKMASHPLKGWFAVIMM
jgi:hypothetical protein